jgi:superfamily II DNA/RNA helicase
MLGHKLPSDMLHSASRLLFARAWPFCGPLRRFHTLNLKENIVSGLQSLGYTQPTEIQRLCVPNIVQRKSHVVVNAETGSGKTLAFLLPILQADIKKSLVLAPTRELAQQIAKVFNSVSAAAAASDGTLPKHARVLSPSDDPVLNADLIVATPQILKSPMLVESIASFDYVVLDEADAIFSGEEARTKMLLNTLLPKRRDMLRAQATLPGEPLEGPQFVFVGATLPTRGDHSFLGELKHRLPHLVHLSSSR